jgi:uroporphyrinogen decarboxylase
MKLKQDRMNSQERMDALFNYRKPDRIPIGSMATTFCSSNAGYPVTTAYGDPEKSFNAMLWAAEQYGWDPVPQVFGHTVLGALDFGGKFRLPKGEYEGGIIVECHPVKTEGDILKLEMPDPRAAGRIPKVMEFSRLQEAHGLPVWFFSRSPFTMAADICGLDQFLRWMVKKPELCEELMKMAIDHSFDVLQYWVESFGPEKIFVYMSSPSESNQVISPGHFVKFALPYHSEYHRRLRSVGITRRFAFHICGDQNLNLPYLSELSPWPHPSVLSLGHAVDLEAAARYFPDDIIYGNIEPAVIRVGTPRQIYDLAKIAIHKGKRARGGFILGSGCGMSYGSPPVNVFAMTRAINDFGWYE